MKASVSLRLENRLLDKADILAISEERSRNFIINQLLNEILQILEKNDGKIDIDNSALEEFRSKRAR